MTKNKNHITHLTPELIERYHKGELSEAEQHEVEKLMLHSPFDDEAAEGFKQYEGDMIADLAQLNATLEKRISEEKTDKKFFWLKIAASALILALSSYLIWDISDDSTVLGISQNENAPVIPEESLAIEENVTEVDSPAIDTEELISMTNEQDEIPKPTAAVEEIVASQPEPVAEGIATELQEKDFEDADIIADIATDDTESVEQTMDLAKVEEPVEAEAIMEDMAAPTQKKEVASRSRLAKSSSSAGFSKHNSKRKISGKITAKEDGSPLPGANVIVKGSKQGTVSDIDGNYILDSVPMEKDALVISFIGLATEEVAIDTQSIVNVEMDPDASQLSEVVVTGYGVGSVERSYISASPEIGMRSYKKYLNESIKYPTDSVSEKGKVIIAFDVEKDGSLSNFKIEKSLRKWQDQEALRLIKEGSKWRPAEKSGDKIRSAGRAVIKFNKK